MRYSIRDEYAPKFGRQRLTLWGGSFASDHYGDALELPKRDGYMVTLYDGRKVRVTCETPRTEENYLSVDAAISEAVTADNDPCVTLPHTWSDSGARCVLCGLAGTGDACGDGDCPQSRDMARWLEQNHRAAETITPEQIRAVAQYAEHHAGGLFVLGGDTPGDHYVKCHDSWGDDASVIVHTYDPDAEDPEFSDTETIAEYATGTEAVAAFLLAVEGEQ